MEDANFEDLLMKDSSWTIHENNIRKLLIEIHKSLNHISLPIMQELDNNNNINNNLLKLPQTNNINTRYST